MNGPMHLGCGPKSSTCCPFTPAPQNASQSLAECSSHKCTAIRAEHHPTFSNVKRLQLAEVAQRPVRGAACARHQYLYPQCVWQTPRSSSSGTTTDALAAASLHELHTSAYESAAARSVPCQGNLKIVDRVTKEGPSSSSGTSSEQYAVAPLHEPHTPAW